MKTNQAELIRGQCDVSIDVTDSCNDFSIG